jgi:hypothetical protein
MRNYSDSSCRENQNTFYVQNFFFYRKSCLVLDNVGKCSRVSEAPGDIMATRVTCCVRKSTDPQLTYASPFQCNNGCKKAPPCYVYWYNMCLVANSWRFMCYDVNGNHLIFIWLLLPLRDRIYRMRLRRSQKPQRISLVHHFACRFIQQRSVLEVRKTRLIIRVPELLLCPLLVTGRVGHRSKIPQSVCHSWWHWCHQECDRAEDMASTFVVQAGNLTEWRVRW